MKIYPSDNLQPVNSVARKRKRVEVPPFNLVGPNQPGVSDLWEPTVNCEVIGGFVLARTTGISEAGFAVLKNNIFEQNIIVASTILAPNDTKSLLTLANPLGGLTFSKYDWITVASFSDSGHAGITVQLIVEEIN